MVRGEFFCFYVFLSDVLRLGVDKPKLRTATPALHGPTTLCAAMQRFGGAAASHWPLWVGGLRQWSQCG